MAYLKSSQNKTESYAMSDASRLMEELVGISEKMQKMIARITSLGGIAYQQKINPIIEDFDSSFFEIQDVIPYLTKGSLSEQKRMSAEALETIKKRKEKILIRYTDEIMQVSNRYKILAKNVTEDMQSMCAQIKKHEDKFKDDQKSLRFQRDIALQIHKKQMNAYKAEICANESKHKLNFDNKTKSEKDKLDSIQQEQYDKRAQKIESLHQSIEDVKKEKIQRSDVFVTSETEINNAHDAKKAKLRSEADEELDQLRKEGDAIKKDIAKYKESLVAIAGKTVGYQRTFGNRMAQLKATMKSKQANLIKSWTLKIGRAKESIELVEEEIKKHKSVTVAADTKYLEKLQKEIQIEESKKSFEEIELRKLKKYHFENEAEKFRSKLEDLNKEINENRTKAKETIDRINREMREKVEAIKEKNKAEIVELNIELNKITKYQSHVEDEWASMRESTTQIYKNRVAEGIEKLAKQKKDHDEEVLRITKEGIPKEDPIDYEALLKEELDAVEAEYKTEEESTERERIVLGQAKLEEDKARGHITTRKQNLVELTAQKDAEEELRGQMEMEAMEYKQKSEETLFNLEKEKAMLKVQHETAVTELEEKNEAEVKELHQKRDAMRVRRDALRQEREEIESLLKKQRIQAQAIDEANRLIPLKLLKETEKRHEVILNAQKEVNKKLQEELDSINATKDSLEDENKRLDESIDTATHELNERRKQFLDSIEKKKAEIERNYKFAIIENTQIFDNLKINWKSERDALLSTVDERRKMIMNSKDTLDKLEYRFEQETLKKLMEERSRVEGENYDKLKELMDKNKEEMDKIQKQLKDIAFEQRKEATWLAQDLRMEVVKYRDERKAELDEMRSVLSSFVGQVEELKKQYADASSSECKKCKDLDEMIMFIKRDIVDTVAQTQQLETADLNRSYSASHFGSIKAKELPPLKDEN